MGSPRPVWCLNLSTTNLQNLHPDRTRWHLQFYLAHIVAKAAFLVFLYFLSPLFRAAITAPGPEATRREPIGFREKSQSSGEQIMRRIQGEAKSHAALLSLKCDPGDHTRSSAGCAYMHCLTARLKTHARALMSPEHVGGLNTFVDQWTQQGGKCALQVKVSNALKKSAIIAAWVQHQGQFYCRGSRTDDTCPRASENVDWMKLYKGF